MKDFYCEQALSGKTPIKIEVETANILAFHHTKPHWPVHIVVIPKRHIESLLTLTSNDLEIIIEILETIKKLSAKIVEDTGACRVLTNLGEYQDSKHLHFHLSSGEPLTQ